MAQSIYQGKCIGGPLDGEIHRQITKPPTVAGVFNYENLDTGMCGSYEFRFGVHGWVWADRPIQPHSN